MEYGPVWLAHCAPHPLAAPPPVLAVVCLGGGVGVGGQPGPQQAGRDLPRVVVVAPWAGRGHAR